MNELCSDIEIEARRRSLGHFVFPGLFDGEHVFHIEPRAEGGIGFVQREEFRGVLAPLILRWIGGDTLAGFKAMNEALKAEAERAASTSS